MMSPHLQLVATARPRLLIVDDDATVLSALGSLLSEGHDVRVARTGRDALRLARLEPPDLVLLDVGLPDLDGYEICRRLKEDALTAEVPVVFLTAHSGEEAEVKGLQAGAADFIGKPPRRSVVLARVANLVRMKRLTDRLHLEAMTDGLTALANRPHFDRTLHVEWLRAMRNGHPLGLLMIDIDHFKAYNDHHGHVGGDDCLRRVARTLQQVVRRPSDLVARYGGEEFVILLPETDAGGTGRVAQAVMAAVAQADIAHGASATAAHVTLSVGGATADIRALGQQPWPVDSGFMHSVAHQPELVLIEAADHALYAAKHHGRNQAWMRDMQTGAERRLHEAPPPAVLRHGAP